MGRRLHTNRVGKGDKVSNVTLNGQCAIIDDDGVIKVFVLSSVESLVVTKCSKTTSYTLLTMSSGATTRLLLDNSDIGKLVDSVVAVNSAIMLTEVQHETP